IWWLVQGRRHHLIGIRHLGLYLMGALVSLAPNLIWNLNNGFVTARHLSHNANLDEPHYSITGSLEFLLAQGGIVGPLVLVVMIAVMVQQRRHPSAPFWIALFIPAISVITVQGFFSDANANWAIASWPPAVVLTAGLLAAMATRWRQVMTAGIAINTGLMLVVLVASMMGSLGPLTPASDPFRRLRHWDAHAADLMAFASAHTATTIVTERRGTAAKLIWETRHYGMTIELVDANGIAENHFEQRHPWRPSSRAIVLVNEESLPSPLDGVTWAGVMAASDHRISSKRSRALRFHLGREAE
ncbi:MAG: hypothetical protein J4F41_00940, partial [Alphaproteobacteria bacterium]|nr:hypothetical protein [Alphaproteobacteria bacterium]